MHYNNAYVIMDNKYVYKTQLITYLQLRHMCMINAYQ